MSIIKILLALGAMSVAAVTHATTDTLVNETMSASRNKMKATGSIEVAGDAGLYTVKTKFNAKLKSRTDRARANLVVKVIGADGSVIWEDHQTLTIRGSLRRKSKSKSLQNVGYLTGALARKIEQGASVKFQVYIDHHDTWENMITTEIEKRVL